MGGKHRPSGPAKVLAIRVIRGCFCSFQVNYSRSSFSCTETAHRRMKTGGEVGAGCQTALGEHRHFKPRPAAGAYLFSEKIL